MFNAMRTEHLIELIVDDADGSGWRYIVENRASKLDNLLLFGDLNQNVGGGNIEVPNLVSQLRTVYGPNLQCIDCCT